MLIDYYALYFVTGISSKNRIVDDHLLMEVSTHISSDL